MRSTVLLILNSIALITIVIVFLYSVKNYWIESRNPAMLLLIFVVVLVGTIIFILIGNKFLDSMAAISLDTKVKDEITIDLQERHSEAVFDIEYEIRPEIGKIVTFDYKGVLEKDGVVIKEFNFQISNLGPGMVPDSSELRYSAYTKDSFQAIIKPIELGNYLYRSNRASAPKEVSITEYLKLYK